MSKYVFAIGGVVSGVVVGGGVGITITGPENATTYVVDDSTKVDTGWTVSGTDQSPTFTEPNHG